MTSIPEISARGSLILWAKCQIPVGPRPCVGPRSGREGEKCRSLDHRKHIPFIHQLCSHTTLRTISTYIQNCSSYFFNVVFMFCFGTLYICDLRMRSSRTTYSRYSAILKSFCPLCSTYWYEIQRESLKLGKDASQYGVGNIAKSEFYDFTKGNGVNHTQNAPYHPRTNGQAGKFCSNF